MENHSTFPWTASLPAAAERAATHSLSPARLEPAPRTAPNLPGLSDDLFAGIELVPLELVGSSPQAERHPSHGAEAGGSPALVSFATDGGSALPNAAPLAVAADAGAGAPLVVTPNPAALNEAALLAMANFGTAAAGSVGPLNPLAAPIGTALTPPGASTGPGGGGGNGSTDGHREPPGGHHRGKDPLWVLDANNGLVLANGGTIHDFAHWNVDLYAQVSGATVAANGYTWTYSSAPDVYLLSVTGQGTYHLHFQWNNFSDTQNPVHSDTIALQTTNTDGTHQNQTFYFAVYANNTQAWVDNQYRPTTTPTFPLLVPPDAVKPDQETIDAQYYSLSEATGEVMTHHTLPAYHPAVDPLQLDYSSLAANPRPIFHEYYQLSQNPTSTSTVTATLKLNGVTQGSTASYDTSLLNLGDILDIALQGDATSLTTGRYPYEIDVTENSLVQIPQTGSVNIVNAANSPFGAGWSLDNLEHLWFQGTCGASGSGAFVELPGGLSLWFAYDATMGKFITPPGDFSTLTQNGTCATSPRYTRTLKDGTQINFDSSGKQTSIQDVISNRATVFHYNTPTPPQLTSITDFQNVAMTLTYNPAGKVSGIQDVASRTTQLGYDATNTFLTSITDPDPGSSETIPVVTYGYDTSSNRLTSLTDADNHQTAFSYVSYSGRINTVTRADQTTEALTPQQMDGLLAPGDHTAALAVVAGAEYIDPRSNGWFDTLDRSGFGHGTEYFDPPGDETIVHRDNNGLPWLAEDPLDRATRTFFDQGSSRAQGNPTTVVLPDGNFEQSTYTTLSQATSLTDAKGNTTTVSYYQPPAVACFCPASITRPPVPGGNPTNQFGYTDQGFMTASSDASGDIMFYGYDDHSRDTSMTYPPDSGTPGSGPTITLAYNTASNLIWFEDELSHVTTYTEDNLGRVLAVALPTGGVITITFDTAGNRTSLTDPLPLPNPQTDKTQFHFDAMNRLDRVTDPNNLVTTYAYDAAGHIQDIYDRDILQPSGNHRDRHFIYDDAGRLITEQWKDGSTVNYSANYGYDAASEPTSVSDNNSAYSLAYDARGRRSSIDNANTPNMPHVVLTYQYDAAGNRTQLSDNLSPAGTITFGYDTNNRLTALAMNVAGASDKPVVTLQYDLESRLTNISRTTSSGGNQVNTALAYTHRDLVQSIAHTSSTGAMNLAAYTFGYDAAQNLQTYSGPDLAGGIVTLSYSYDALNQLTGVTADSMHPVYNESYSYTNLQSQDLNGNRYSASVSGGTAQVYGAPAPANRLTSDGQYVYTYDNEGNLLNKTGLEAGVTISYDNTWDNRNRLTEAKKTQVSGSQVLADDRFTYDVFDRRIGKLTQGGTPMWTAYDGDNVYADFSGSSLSTRYLYGNGQDELYARTNSSGNSTDWYLTDHLGSVRLIVDASGASLYSVNYFSFGGIVPGSESGTGGDRFKFAGREWDKEISLYYNRARYYDPNTGRFISEDPLGFWAGDPNLSRYVFNGPTVGTDRSGLFADSVSLSLARDPELAAWLAGAGMGGGAMLTPPAQRAIQRALQEMARRCVEMAKAAARELEIQPGKYAKPGGGLTEEDAADIVRRGGDVIAKDKDTAKRIAEQAGDGPPIWEGPHGPGQKPHYHPSGRGGGHVLY